MRAGPLEQFVQVLLHEAQPQRIAVRYEYSGGGLIVSEDGGRTFALVCAPAIAPDLRPGAAVLDGEGRLRIASFYGLFSDDRRACGWAPEPALRGRWVGDVAADPTLPGVTFAVTNGATADNAIYRGQGDGEFVRLGTPDDALVGRLRVVDRAGSLRFYQSVVRGSTQIDFGNGAEEVPNYVVRHSDDLGERWTEHAFPPLRATMRLEAVDPTDPDRLVVSVARSGSGGTTLYVSRDAGATFRSYLELAALGGLVITAEGEVYIGDAGDASGAQTTRGLYRAKSLAEPAALVSDEWPVHCLGYRNSDGTLYACDRYTFGIADPDSGELAPLVKLTSLERFVECPGVDVQAQCEAPMLQGYCGVTHFPCAPICDPYAVDLSDLASAAGSDPMLAACFARRDLEPQSGSPNPPPAAADAGAEDFTPPDPPPSPPMAAETQARYSCQLATGPTGGAGVAGWSVWALAALALRRRRRRAPAR